MKSKLFSKIALAGAFAAAASLALAAPEVDQAAIDARYQSDRQACMSQAEAGGVREVCMQEAGAARQAALNGELSGGNRPAELQRNALSRCEVHTNPVDRSACERMVKGEGASVGSVESGGVLRETITVIKPEPAAAGQ